MGSKQRTPGRRSTGDAVVRRHLDASPEPRCITDGRIVLHANPACHTLYGWQDADRRGRRLEDVCTSDALSGIRTGIAYAMRTGLAYQVIEETMERPDGTVRELEVLISPIRFGGKPAAHVLFRELPETRRVLKALKASEKRFRSFVENVFDGVYLSTPAGELLMVNTAMVRMLGYGSAEELMSLPSAADLYAHPERRIPLLRRAEEQDGYRDVELDLKRKDGSVITCLENTRVVRKSTGEVMYYEGTLKDVTEWMKVQDDLRNSEERYRAFITQSTEGIWCLELEEPLPARTDPSEQIRHIVASAFVKESNFETARLLGYGRPEEILGARITDLIDMDARQGVVALRVFVESGYRLENVETMVPMAEHQDERHLQSNVVGIVEDGRLVRAWGTMRDVTAQKRAEAQLRKSEEQYRDFFDEDLAGHFISEPGGRVIACNSAFARIMGYDSVAEVLATSALEFYPTPEGREELLRKLRTKRKLDTVEVELKRKDGRLITVVENVQGTFDAHGDLVQVRGFMIDMSERKDLEDKLREAQKMETLGTLAGGVAHDFNNILAVIRGYVDLLRREHLLAPTGEKFVQAIDTAVRRGAGVVRQLMAFAREDRQVLAPVDITTLIEEIADLSRVTMPERLSLDIRVTAGLPLITGDESQIHQALLNLVVNARDAMPGRGTLTIAASVVSGDEVRRIYPDADHDRYIAVSVADEGAGMSEETRERIFEPFFTTKDIGKGSGLGLAVVYGVVRGHDGFVDVGSNGEQGTVFTLYFPAREAVAAPSAPAAPAARNVSGSETVLVIEDEEMLLDLLTILLESNGYRVLQAADGEAALSIYRQDPHAVSVVLSDMGLPKLGGYEVFQKMKEINPRVRSILASGYMDPNLRTTLLEAGAVDFIQKPYIPEQILLKIRETIDHG